MAWLDPLAVVLFVTAVALVGYRYWFGERSASESAGWAVFLVGVAVALFVDDALLAVAAVDRTQPSWVEPLGVGVALVGAAVALVRKKSGT